MFPLFSASSRLLLFASGAALLATALAAPWLHAGTRPEGLRWITIGLLAAGALWTLSRLLPGEKSPLPRVLLGAVGVLLAVGWTVTLTGPHVAPEAFTAAQVERIAAKWPEAFFARSPREAMALATGILVAVLIACDLGWRRRSRALLGAALALNGVGIVALGLWQNAEGARGIYFEPVKWMPGYFFATFFHHTSAGAYLNLLWPIAASLALFWLSKERHSRLRGLLLALPWAAATCLYAAGHFGHVSRAPQVIALGLVAVLFLIAWRRMTRDYLRRRWVLLVAAGLLAVPATGWITSKTERLETIIERWQMLWSGDTPHPTATNPAPERWTSLLRDDLIVEAYHFDSPLGDRGEAWRAGWRAFRQAPWVGTGPASWTAAYSHHSENPFVRSFYLYVQFAHSDPIQTLVEWGLIGFAGWAVIVLGGLLAVGRWLRETIRTSRHLEAGDAVVLGAALGLVAVLLQSLFDFPLQIPALQANAAVLLGLMWASRVSVEQRAKSPEPRAPWLPRTEKGSRKAEGFSRRDAEARRMG